MLELQIMKKYETLNTSKSISMHPAHGTFCRTIHTSVGWVSKQELFLAVIRLLPRVHNCHSKIKEPALTLSMILSKTQKNHP
jgi:hypothetical protein